MAKGLAVGLNKGYIVTKIEIPSWTPVKRRIYIFLSLSQKKSTFN